MSDQITTAFMQQYKAGIEILVQQKGSRLRSCVRVEDQVGKQSFYDQLGSTTVRERTVRHGDSPYIATPHSRRMCILKDYDWGDYIDSEDKIRTLNDPSNQYTVNAAFAFGRKIDEVLLDAASGDAKTGETGGDTTPLPSTQKIGGSVPMSLALLLQAKEILDENETDPDQPRYIACTAAQITSLLNTTEVKSSDFNTVKALASGQINTYLGFEFKRVNSGLFNTVGSDDACIAWSRPGLLLAIGAELVARVTERSDKGFSWYAFNRMSFAATRMQEELVVEIACNEA